MLTRTLLNPFLFNPLQTPAPYYISILSVLINTHLCTRQLVFLSSYNSYRCISDPLLAVAHSVHPIPLYFIPLIIDLLDAE
jgi:hypothetical protein